MRKDIVTGILVTGLLAAVSAFIPILGMLCAVLIPIPIMGYRVKAGRAAAAAIAGAVLAAAGWLGGGADMLFFGVLLLLGFVLAETALAGYSLERSALTACAAATAAGGLGLAALASMAGTTAQRLLAETVRLHLELTVALYRQMGVAEEQVRFLADSLETLQRVLVGATPALAASALLVTIWICTLMAPFFFRWIGLAAPDRGELDHWKAPEVLVWAAIGGGVLLLLPGFTVNMVGLNALLVLMTVYFFQGIAIVAFYFRKKRVPRAARILLYSLIFIQQLLMLAVVAAGFFDTWINFRRIGKPLAPTPAE